MKWPFFTPILFLLPLTLTSPTSNSCWEVCYTEMPECEAPFVSYTFPPPKL